MTKTIKKLKKDLKKAFEECKGGKMHFHEYEEIQDLLRDLDYEILMPLAVNSFMHDPCEHSFIEDENEQ
jgi:hypothetical protein